MWLTACSPASSRSVVVTPCRRSPHLDPIYKQLLDEPVTATIAVAGGDGLPNLTPVWFDYEGDLVLLNLATHRKKVDWLRKDPHATFLLVNPANAYHWLSIRCTVARELSEDDPDERPARHRPAGQDLDQVHRQRAALRPPRPLDRRAPGAVRARDRRPGRPRLGRGRQTAARRSGGRSAEYARRVAGASPWSAGRSAGSPRRWCWPTRLRRGRLRAVARRRSKRAGRASRCSTRPCAGSPSARPSTPTSCAAAPGTSASSTPTARSCTSGSTATGSPPGTRSTARCSPSSRRSATCSGRRSWGSRRTATAWRSRCARARPPGPTWSCAPTGSGAPRGRTCCPR